MIDIPAWAEFTFEVTTGGTLYCGNGKQYQRLGIDTYPNTWSPAAYHAWLTDASAKPVVLQLEND